MKKVIAILLAVVTLVTVFVMPVGATSVDVGTISSSMTEDEFRTYSSDMNFSLQNSKILQSSSYSSYDYSYYYDVLRSKYSNSFEYAAYNAAAENFDNFTSGTWEFTFTTDYLNGQYYNSSQTSQFYQLANTILDHSMAGGWCYRYDNILECDRFTCTVSSNMSFDLNYSNQVTKTYVTLYCVDHPYYNAYELSQRDAAIDEIVATANTKSNTYEMLKYIHDTLIRGADYDYDALSANTDSRRFYYAHSSIGVLIKGEGVCESYAKAFKEVCDRLSIFIPVAVLTSNTHMWNIVYLDNKWYCLDATWDDWGGSQIDYTYFLCGDPDKIDGTSTDHVPDGIYTDAPTYASDYYNPNKATSGWQISGGKKYYYENGVKVTGWLYYAGYWYYFDNSGVMVTGWMVIDGEKHYFDTNGIEVTGWATIDGKRYYFNNSGAMVTGWQIIDGKQYYFDARGMLVTGHVIIDGTKYYLDGSGAMHTGWLNNDGKWYYYDGVGAMKTGWANIGRVWYYFDNQGVMKTGWLSSGGTWYYFEDSGAMKIGWANINGTWYFFDGSGAMRTGWAGVGGKWYYFDASGAMKTGWLSNGGTWYYLGTSGAMVTGWQVINGTWYYFNTSGAMATGWLNSGGTWYYFDGSGAMKTGWLYDGAWYYFYSSGAMATNIYIDGGYIDASGVWR